MSIKVNLQNRLRFLNALHAGNSENPVRAYMLSAIKQFERNRLRYSYKDFSEKKAYRLAVEFMIEELFCKDQRKRDLEMEQAYPAMIRLLPEYVLGTVLSAIEFSILTVNYETCLAKHFQDTVKDIDESIYCQAFRAADCRLHREAQLALLLKVGQDLDLIVHKPFIGATLKLCRQPARLAGLTELQHFLEQGLYAFKSMQNSALLLQTFSEREQQIIESIMNGRENTFLRFD